MLPRHRVLLFLFKSQSGAWEVQGYSGWYEIRDGAVKALTFNPFGPSIAGRPEAEITQLILATPDIA